MQGGGIGKAGRRKKDWLEREGGRKNSLLLFSWQIFKYKVMKSYI